MNLLNRTRTAVARLIAPPTKSRRFEAVYGRRWSAAPFGRMASESVAAAAPLRNRARDAYANNPHARAAVEAWVTALVGTGARALPKHPDANSRAAIATALEDWADDADINGLTDWYGLQAEIARALVIDGEALVLQIEGPSGLRLRLLPAEMLADDETRDLGGGRQIVGGVEFDGQGRRVAYWIRPELPAAAWLTLAAPERVDAADVIHIFKPLGAGQVRGVSWLAPVLLKLGEIDQLSDALLVGFKISSMYVGFLENTNDLAVTDGGAALFGTDKLESGTIKVLPAGHKLNFSAPQQAQQAPDFLAAELRSVAVGMGVPAHLITGDLSKANYGSLRADLVAFRQRYEQIQYGTLAPVLLRRIYGRAVTSLILAGRLAADGFESDPRAWTAAEFLFPAPPWIDPAKDAAAYRELIDSGLMSRRQAVAERGWSVEALDEEIANDRAREGALGISFGTAPAAKLQQQQEPQADD